MSESLDASIPGPIADRAGRVLVVDDNRMNRVKLTRVLVEQGHEALTAQNGREALEILAAAGASNASEDAIDVVLLDLVMPEMDGFATLQAIRADAAMQHVIVIVISAVDEMDSIVRCIEMGAEDYLPKPFDPVLLRARLHTSLEKKKLRDLERAYLQQDLVLRQNEKLATLGKLCAGIAHDLNNPSAAAQRGASELPAALERLRQAQFQFHVCKLTHEQSDALLALYTRIVDSVERPLRLDTLAFSDRQQEIENLLEDQGVDEVWEFSSDLVALGFESEDIPSLAATFGADLLSTVLVWMSANYTLYALAREIGDAAQRISSIIRALKSYSFMDQSPLQSVDVREGLDDTLTMLRHKLGDGVVVERAYAPDLPRIDAYGSELNQVWTNLIDNALSAMAGQGKLSVRAELQAPWLVVSVTDSGPGIRAEIQPKIFDPFFTTKPPGEGTGLGLNISHNIIVHKHQGQISVHSQPGETRFEVRLPLTLPASHSDAPVD